MAFRPDHYTTYDHDAGTVTVSLTMTIEQFHMINNYTNPHVGLWDDGADDPYGPDGAITLNEIHDDGNIERVTVKPNGAVTRAVLDRTHGGFHHYSYASMECGY